MPLSRALLDLDDNSSEFCDTWVRLWTDVKLAPLLSLSPGRINSPVHMCTSGPQSQLPHHLVAYVQSKRPLGHSWGFGEACFCPVFLDVWTPPVWPQTGLEVWTSCSICAIAVSPSPRTGNAGILKSTHTHLLEKDVWVAGSVAHLGLLRVVDHGACIWCGCSGVHCLNTDLCS